MKPRLLQNGRLSPGLEETLAAGFDANLRSFFHDGSLKTPVAA